jgi:hypothetical protein
MVQRIVRSKRILFERESELAAVDEALDELAGLRTDGAEAADRPRGALLAVAGRAGIGKTTLLAEIRRRATARGCTVLSARGGDQEQRVAFHVARQLLQPEFAGSGESDLRASLGSWYDIVGPALGLCAPTAAAPPDPQGLRDGMDWVLTHLAVLRAPMVLVLDDAHWADPESLRWLAAFAPRAEQLPLLVVVAYRPDELPDHAEPLRGLPGRAGGRPLDLEPLSAAAVARLVRETFGPLADDAFCRECWAVTAGSPFETVELIAKVRDRGLTCCAIWPQPSRAAASSPASNVWAPRPSASRGPAPSSAPRSIRSSPPPSPALATRRPPTPPTPCAAPASSPAATPWSSSTR